MHLTKTKSKLVQNLQRGGGSTDDNALHSYNSLTPHPGRTDTPAGPWLCFTGMIPDSSHHRTYCAAIRQTDLPLVHWTSRVAESLILSRRDCTPKYRERPQPPSISTRAHEQRCAKHKAHNGRRAGIICSCFPDGVRPQEMSLLYYRTFQQSGVSADTQEGVVCLPYGQ